MLQEVPKKTGRPAQRAMPPLPPEILSGMSAVEKDHFLFFIQAYETMCKSRYNKVSQTASICILQAALDYIHLLRLQGSQMTSGVLVSQARQHPGVQVRAWLASAGLQEKDLDQQQPTKSDPIKDALLKLSR